MRRAGREEAFFGRSDMPAGSGEGRPGYVESRAEKNTAPRRPLAGLHAGRNVHDIDIFAGPIARNPLRPFLGSGTATITPFVVMLPGCGMFAVGGCLVGRLEVGSDGRPPSFAMLVGHSIAFGARRSDILDVVKN